MGRLAVRCTVEGRVQGVFYRAETSALAAQLGIDGWVTNRSDGSVELVAAGSPQAVEQLVAWLWQGPAKAQVTAVTIDEWTEAVDKGFRIAG